MRSFNTFLLGIKQVKSKAPFVVSLRRPCVTQISYLNGNRPTFTHFCASRQDQLHNHMHQADDQCSNPENSKSTRTSVLLEH